jgi:hypothetical protein
MGSTVAMKMGYPRLAAGLTLQRPNGPIGFKESLQDWKPGHIPRGHPQGVLLASSVHPAPPAQFPDGSLAFWIWLVVIVAVAVVGGIVLTLRR